MEAERQKWLGTLEIISIRKPDEAEAEWAWVMKELGLGPEAFLAVYEAVRQGRWREAENPGGYLKSVAQREQRNAGRDGIPGERKGPRGLRGMQGLDWRDAGEEVTIGRVGGWGAHGFDRGGSSHDDAGEPISAEDRLDNLEYRADSGRPVRDRDGTWRTGAGWGGDHEGLLRPAPRPRQRIESGLNRYSERGNAMGDERNAPYIERGPDFQAWAEKAGLNEWEKKVAEYKMRGVGWREAVAEQPDEESKRALRSAWVTMDRSGMERLRASSQHSAIDIQPFDGKERKTGVREPDAPKREEG